MRACLSWFPTLALLATVAHAQSFEISEVLPAPILGDPIVEITNVTDDVLDASDVRILIDGSTHQRLPSVNIAPGAYVRIHIGVSGTNTPTDLFTPDAGPLILQQGAVALYQGEVVGDLGTFFENSDHVVDFMQWGAPNQPLAGVAEAAWVWFFANTAIPAPFPTESLAWDEVGNQPGNWFRDISPTLGGPNVQPTASVTIFGGGCSPAAAGPAIGATSPPALGNKDFALSVWSQSQGEPALLFMGLSTTTIPVFGGDCFFHVDQVFRQTPFVIPSAGTYVLPAPIPEDPTLMGVEVVFGVAVANGFGLPVFGIDLSPALVVRL
jgi:hypothetical protein